MFTDAMKLIIGIAGFGIVGLVIFMGVVMLIDMYSRVKTEIALIRNRITNLELFVKDKIEK